MKTKEIRAASNAESSSRLAEFKKELMKLNTEVSVSNPKNPGRIRQIKREIARVITIQNQKNIQEKQTYKRDNQEKQKETHKKA